VNEGKTADFNSSKLKTELNELVIDEYKKDNVSLFDLATILKVSTPSAAFDKNLGADIMRVMLDTFYEYMKNVTVESELNNVFGKFVKEQYEIFESNMNWYYTGWKDNFSEYISDMIRVAVETLEDKEMVSIGEEIKKAQDKFERARENTVKA
jgi:hypothetical protein